MRAHIPSFEMHTPHSLSEALLVLERIDSSTKKPLWKPFAGGTDIMVMLEAGKLSHFKWLNLSDLSELKTILVTDNQISIGALCTYSDMAQNKVIQSEFPLLVEAALLTGAKAIQNRGTIGGNIANSSPAADTPPALLVYEADLELVSNQQKRSVPYNSFHTGYKTSLLKANELIHSVQLKRDSAHQNKTSYYHKVGTRKSQAISKVCLAAVAHHLNDKITDIKMAFGSVAPIPLRAPKTEALLKSENFLKMNDNTFIIFLTKAKQTLSQEISPIDDIRSNREYRLQVSQNLLELFVEKVRTHKT